MSLIRLINAYDAAYRSLGHHTLPAGPAWDADMRQLETAAVTLLAYECNSMSRYRRWIGYVRAVADLSRRVSRDQAAAKAEIARLRDPATRNRRSFDDPQTTYEFGIDGSDRIAVVPPRKGWSRYHKRYPFELMEIGETITIAGMKNRAGIGVTLKTIESRHERKFKTKTVEAGLCIKRIT